MEGVKTHMGIIDVFKGERNVIPKQEVKPFQVSQKQWRSSGDSRTNERRAEMERELEKDLKEIEYLIYVHKNRGNTNTQSVLERVHEIIEPCAKAARTLSELEELLSRENGPEITRSSRDSQFGECSQREVYMKAYEDALNEDSVSEAFLADCKRVAQKYKKDNDGWIPVEERLPEEEVSVLAQWEKYDKYLNVKLIYLDVMWLDDAEKKVFETINGVPNGKVPAWRPLPDPYRPERSVEE